MQSWRGAEPVPAPCAALVLHLASYQDRWGLIHYVYSVAPGVTVDVCAGAGPVIVAADDPAILAEVARLEEATHDYAGTDRA